MVRTQIQLTPGQAKHLRRISAERRKSVAELIRTSVDLFVESTTGSGERFARAKSVAGKFGSGSKDGSAGHDRHLAEAFAGK